MKKFIAVFILVIGGGGFYISQREVVETGDAPFTTTPWSYVNTPVMVTYYSTPPAGEPGMAGWIVAARVADENMIEPTDAEKGITENSNGSRYLSPTLDLVEYDANTTCANPQAYKVNLVTAPTGVVFR